MKEQRNRSIGRWPAYALAALAVALAPGAVAPSHAAITPVFRQTNAGSNPSVLIMTHDVDATAGSPAPTTSTYTGSTSTTPGLLSPFSGTGNNITVSGGSSNAKGGAGHSEGSNLARITFPSGAGVDQTDPSVHDVDPSVFTEQFNFRWDLGAGTFGGANATFSVPVGAKIGTGAGAFAKFEYAINWDRVINGVTTAARGDFIGSKTFGNVSGSDYTGPGPWLVNVSSTAFVPAFSSDGGGNDFLIMHGHIRFIANNDDGMSVIELMGPTQDLGPDISPELRNNAQFMNLWANQVDNEFRYYSNAGFEPEIVPEPSASLLLGAGACLMTLRRRRRGDAVIA